MSYEIVTKYIKDLNFKISDAKSYFLLEKDIKNYTFVCDIKSKNFKENYSSRYKFTINSYK